MRQPKSGRMGRSPGEVDRISRIASAISRSRATIAMPPVVPTPSGNAQPRPRKSVIAPSSRDRDVHRQALDVGGAATRLDERRGRGGGLAAEGDGGAAGHHLAHLELDVHLRRVAGVQAGVGDGRIALGADDGNRLAVDGHALDEVLVEHAHERQRRGARDGRAERPDQLMGAGQAALGRGALHDVALDRRLCQQLIATLAPLIVMFALAFRSTVLPASMLIAPAALMTMSPLVSIVSFLPSAWMVM